MTNRDHLDVWTFQLVRAARAFKRLNTSHLRTGGKTTGSIGRFAVTTAAIDLIHYAVKAAHYANDILGREHK
jgi:hypothetical protein